MGEDRRQFGDASAFLNRQANSMTLIEACIVIVVVTVLLVFAVLLALRAREENKKKACQENLSQIGKAITAYSMGDTIGFYPFSWGPAEEKAPRNKDAMTSIAELYPSYIVNADIFRCPSTNDRPWFRTNVPFPVKDRNGDGEINDDDVLASEKYVWSNRNHTLMDSSYGYDCRVYPLPFETFAMVADMDGSQGASPDKHTSNHRDGHIVFHADGSVRWQTNNFCADNPGDNIFAEDPWEANADSFISDNTPPGSDDTPGAFDDLSVSYDDYPYLHPSQ